MKQRLLMTLIVILILGALILVATSGDLSTNGVVAYPGPATSTPTPTPTPTPIPPYPGPNDVYLPMVEND